MPRGTDAAKQLANTISQLQAERRTHMDAVERIDALFLQFGIQAAERKRPGRPPGVKSAATPASPAVIGRPAGKRTRRTFAKSGLDSIFDFVSDKGTKGATTGEINKHWKSEGRAGSAYVTIGQLVTKRKLKKRDLKGQRGSCYTAL